MSVDYSVLQIRAHNGYLPPKKKPNAVEFKAELYEIDVDNLVTVDGAGAKTAVAGSSVSVTDEAHGTGWTQGQPIRLNNKDADNSSVQSIVVKGGGSTLTLNTDYRVFVGDGTNGEL